MTADRGSLFHSRGDGLQTVASSENVISGLLMCTLCKHDDVAIMWGVASSQVSRHFVHGTDYPWMTDKNNNHCRTYIHLYLQPLVKPVHWHFHSG